MEIEIFQPRRKTQTVRNEFLFLVLLISLFFHIPVAGEEVNLMETFQRELARAAQSQHAFRTLWLEGEFAISTDRGKTWEKPGKGIIIIDNTANNSYFEHHVKMSGEEISEKVFLGENSLTTIQVRREMKDGKIPESYSSVTIQRERNSLNPVIATLRKFSEYNRHSEKVPIFKNGKIIYEKPVLSQIEYQGRKAIKILSTNEQNQGWIHKSFVFDSKTGNILERETFTFEKENGKLKRSCLDKITVSDYFLCNGIPFPSALTLTYEEGNEIRRFIVNQKTARINEPVDKICFTPVFPPNSNVWDKTKGTYYRTPSVGNISAEKAIAKELDEIFKDADE